MGVIGRWSRALLAGAWLACAGASAQVPVPAATAHVIDQTRSLDTAQAQALETRLDALERERGPQVAVLIIPTTAPETIDQFGIRVADQWRLGKRGADDGVIVLVALNDRAARIEVGYGLEGVLTDAAAHRILEEAMLPRLAVGDIAGAVAAGVDRIVATLSRDGAASSVPAPATGARAAAPGDGTVLLAVFVVAGALGGLLRGLFGRAKAAAATAPVAALTVWWLGAPLGTIVVAAALAAILTGLGVLGGMPWTGRRDGGSSFKGGGGGFGGGGASGRW